MIMARNRPSSSCQFWDKFWAYHQFYRS